MKDYISLLGALIVTFGFGLSLNANAEVTDLPVTTDQCQLEVSEVDFEFQQSYGIVERKFCLFCTLEEVGKKYLSLWVYPTKEIAYFSTVRMATDENATRIIEFFFDRYLTKYLDGRSADVRTRVNIDFNKSTGSRFWTADIRETDQDGEMLRTLTLPVAELNGELTFNYRSQDEVDIQVTCKTP